MKGPPDVQVVVPRNLKSLENVSSSLNRRRDGQTDGQTDRRIDRQTDGQADRQGQIDRQTDGLMDRRTGE